MSLWVDGQAGQLDLQPGVLAAAWEREMSPVVGRRTAYKRSSFRVTFCETVVRRAEKHKQAFTADHGWNSVIYDTDKVRMAP